MTDERVDELLSDLDEALSVEPSPAVAARVRTRIDKSAAPFPVRVRWVVVPAAIATVVLAAYSVWPRGVASPTTSDQQRVTVSQPSVGPGSPSPSAPTLARVVPANMSDTLAKPHDRSAATTNRLGHPEVIVSPNVRIGLEQLQESVKAGRVSAELLSGPGLDFEPTVVRPAVIEIQPVRFELEPVDLRGPGSGGDSKADAPGEPVPIPFRPLSRTRSIL